MKQTNDSTTVYAGEVLEIIGRRADWIYRHGHLILLATAVSLIMLAYGYRYPATVEGEVMLTTVEPPRTLSPSQPMTVAQVWVADRDTVAAGQVLTVAADGTARPEHVLDLEDRLLQLERSEGADAAKLALPHNLVLGSLTDAVLRFRNAQDRYAAAVDGKFTALSPSDLRQQIARRGGELRRYEREVRDVERQLAARDPTERDRLATDALGEELQRRREVVRRTQFLLTHLRGVLSGAETTGEEAIAAARTGVERAFTDLQLAVGRWKRAHTLTSPVAGVVVLEPGLREGVVLSREEVVATILPLDAGRTIGRLSLPVQRSGSVAIGQKVVIEFDTYSRLEYGTVIGTVASTGAVAVDGELTVEVHFPNGLISSRGDRIEATPFLRGRATVLTGSRNLLNLLLDPT